MARKRWGSTSSAGNWATKAPAAATAKERWTVMACARRSRGAGWMSKGWTKGWGHVDAKGWGSQDGKGWQ